LDTLDEGSSVFGLRSKGDPIEVGRQKLIHALGVFAVSIPATGKCVLSLSDLRLSGIGTVGNKSYGKNGE
jgi:hypothetical protein